MKNIKPYAKYKPSGIAWLGDIPEHWEVRKLKYLAVCFPSNVDKHSREGETQVRLCNYTDVYKNDFISDKMKFMLATASNEQIQKFTLLKDDVIITKDSETSNDIAVPAIVTESLTNVVCGYHLSVIRANNDVYAKYLFRLFQHKKFNSQFEICSNGVTRVGLGVYDLVNAFGIKPSYSEQQAIANFLDYKLSKIDRFIAKKKQLIKLLNEQKSAIINDAVTKGLNPNVKMKPSGIEWLGDIPEHWEVRKLSTIIISAELGGNYDSSEVSDGIPVMKMGNLDRSFIKLSRIEYLKKDSFYEVRHILNYGDFLFNTRNSADLVGKVGLWRNELPLSLYNSNILRISFKSEVNNEFMNYLFNSHAILNFLKLIAKGTTNVSAIYYKDLSKIDIWLPNIFEQKDIVSYIEQETAFINTTISTIEKEISLVEEYKTALIAEAVTGKIDVRDYEIAEVLEEEVYEELEGEFSLAAEDEVEYGIE